MVLPWKNNTAPVTGPLSGSWSAPSSGMVSVGMEMSWVRIEIPWIVGRGSWIGPFTFRLVLLRLYAGLRHDLAIAGNVPLQYRSELLGAARDQLVAAVGDDFPCLGPAE